MSCVYISAELRRLVSDRTAHICKYCLYPEVDGLSCQVDHIISVKHGSATTINTRRRGSQLRSSTSKIQVRYRVSVTHATKLSDGEYFTQALKHLLVPKLPYLLHLILCEYHYELVPKSLR
ncbi:HNH endonuclease [Calothrix sp. PCC 7507]|uniref:HNH endonuclease n=1 Tax=Calothrix sp. PCC 7507 TaxID=99598 RepID=UPI00029EC83D|nr:HNH endonuclease [Calothrix sp. PCC 7507]AFY34267.1 hypothetical protein Cal7507_3879 [Calothrix sp. PCC 7507]